MQLFLRIKQSKIRTEELIVSNLNFQIIMIVNNSCKHNLFQLNYSKLRNLQLSSFEGKTPSHEQYCRHF